MTSALTITGLVAVTILCGFTTLQDSGLPYPEVQDNNGSKSVVIKYASKSQVPFPQTAPANTPSFVVSTVFGAPGEQVLVPVTLFNPDRFNVRAVGIIVSFDTANIEALEIQSGSVIGADWFTSSAIVEDVVGFAAINITTPYILEGEICRFRMKIKNTATDGTFAFMNIFFSAFIDSSFRSVANIKVNGGVQVMAAAPPPPQDPVQQFVQSELNLTPTADGGTTITITQQINDSATDTTFIDQTRAFIQDYKSTISFTDSVYTPEPIQTTVGSTTYTVITKVGNDAVSGSANTSGTSLIADVLGASNTILLVAAGNGASGPDGQSGIAGGDGGSVTANAGDNSIVVALAGNGGGGGFVIGTSDGNIGGTGGLSNASITVTSTSGQIVTTGGNGGNGSNASGLETRGGRGGNGGHVKVIGGKGCDLRAIGGNGGNGGNGADNYENKDTAGGGGHGGRGGNAKVTVKVASSEDDDDDDDDDDDNVPVALVTRATGGAGGNGGNGGNGLGKGGSGGNGGRGGNAKVDRAINENTAYGGSGGNGGSGGSGSKTGKNGHGGHSGKASVQGNDD